jgi:hypothetical protein
MEQSDSYSFSELEIWALYACLLEAKFSGDWHDSDIPAGPLVAAVAERLVDALQKSGRFGDNEAWRAWRELTPQRREWQAAVSYVRYRAEWLDAADDERKEYARRLLSPFRVSEEMLLRFIADAVDARDQLASSHESDED